MRDLAARYLPAGDLHEGETALAKIVAEREDPFLVLISTILSQRTRDEMTERASRQLFAKYDTPEAIANADPANLVRLIQPVGFYRQKALQLQNVSRVLLDQYRGTVPGTYEELIALPQVGPNSANCGPVCGCGRPRLARSTPARRCSD